ncbi:MAG: sensor histidine kinase [Candidatus Zipacnadales bacterium]
MHGIVAELLPLALPNSKVVPNALWSETGAALLSVLAIFSLLGALRWRRAPRNTPLPTESPALPTTSSVEDVVTACEKERELLSYDLHDGLAQYVLAAQMHLDTFVGLREADPERAEYELAAARQRIRDATTEVYRIIANLSTVASPDVPLGQAVETHLARLSRFQPWYSELDNRLGEQRFEATIESMVFRVVQEALNNAARHSGSDRVEVRLYTENSNLIATVRDWGCGFDPQAVRWDSRRLGLQGMCNRARLLGGSCEIHSRPGQGTQVTIRVPYRGGKEV